MIEDYVRTLTILRRLISRSSHHDISCDRPMSVSELATPYDPVVLHTYAYKFSCIYKMWLHVQ